MVTRYFPSDKVHHTWDVGHEPAMVIDGGDVVVVHTRDVSDKQITPTSTTADLPRQNRARSYPLAGPLYIKDAAPDATGSRTRMLTCSRASAWI